MFRGGRQGERDREREREMHRGVDIVGRGPGAHGYCLHIYALIVAGIFF